MTDRGIGFFVNVAYLFGAPAFFLLISVASSAITHAFYHKYVREKTSAHLQPRYSRYPYHVLTSRTHIIPLSFHIPPQTAPLPCPLRRSNTSSLRRRRRCHRPIPPHRRPRLSLRLPFHHAPQHDLHRRRHGRSQACPEPHHRAPVLWLQPYRN